MGGKHVPVPMAIQGIYLFNMCQIGGNKNSRYLWRDFEKDPFLASFLPDVCGVIFVVHSSDVERMVEANELYSAQVQELAESRLLNCLQRFQC